MFLNRTVPAAYFPAGRAGERGDGRGVDRGARGTHAAGGDGDLPVHRPGGQHRAARGPPGRLPGGRRPPPRPAAGAPWRATGAWCSRRWGTRSTRRSPAPPTPSPPPWRGSVALRRGAVGRGRAPLRARMGLHTGEVERQGAHYFGAPLYRCARLTAAAHGGQVVLSGGHRGPGAGRPARRGRPARPGRAPAAGPAAAGARVPAHASGRCRATSRALRTLDARPHNLPVQPTRLVGREAELAQPAARLLRRTHAAAHAHRAGRGRARPPGAARRRPTCSTTSPDGVWLRRSWPPLADAGLVPHAVAAALGVREEAGDGRVGHADRCPAPQAPAARAGQLRARPGRPPRGGRRCCAACPHVTRAGHQPGGAAPVRRARASRCPPLAAARRRVAAAPRRRRWRRSRRWRLFVERARGGQAGASPLTDETRRPWPRSAAGWTGCPWPSSWPRRASGSSAPAGPAGPAA